MCFVWLRAPPKIISSCTFLWAGKKVGASTFEAHPLWFSYTVTPPKTNMLNPQKMVDLGWFGSMFLLFSCKGVFLAGCVSVVSWLFGGYTVTFSLEFWWEKPFAFHPTWNRRGGYCFELLLGVDGKLGGLLLERMLCTRWFLYRTRMHIFKLVCL